MLAKQDDKGSLQKTHWRSTSSRKVWWLDNSRSQSPQWGKWISKQSPIRSRGTRSSHSMDSILSVQKKTSQETEKSLRKFLEPSEKPKVIYTDIQFIGIWQILWRSRHGIIELLHLIDLRRMVLLKKAVRRIERRDVCCTVAIRLGWKMVGWFYGMLLPSAKCSRPSWQMEKLLIKDDSENH